MAICKIISLKGELTFSFRNRPNFGTTPGMQHFTADATAPHGLTNVNAVPTAVPAYVPYEYAPNFVCKRTVNR